MSDLNDGVIAIANALKDEGNALLVIHKYSLAAEKYSEAINLNPTAIFYSNRAQALIKLESYGLAIEDANEALKLDPKYIKAYYRRGSANYALGRLKLALKDFKAVVAIVPKDADALKKMKACDKAVKEEAFSKAIESEAIEDVIPDVESMIVDDSYSGPRLDITKDETTSELKSNINIDFVIQMMEHFRDQKSLHRKYVIKILLDAIEYFKKAPTLQRLSLPSDPAGTFTVCGDTHGQYYDLCNIFSINGNPSQTNYYLFNGDFVDRGSFSFETVMTLLAFKLALPEAMFMHRGNHETKNMNKIYGFSGEIKHKYDDVVMNLFSKLFQWLPLASVIQDKVFVVHGGIPAVEGGINITEIESITRGREPPESGVMADLLWADPQPQLGKAPSKRGCAGFSFGPDYTNSFLAANQLNLIIRSHEVRDEGYEEEHDGKCITVFSAPNYCDQMGNKGAYIKFDNPVTMKPNFFKFTAVSHPDIAPMRYAGNMFSL
eukprot:gene16451-22434_t